MGSARCAPVRVVYWVAVRPPSIERIWPVTNDAASETRKMAGPDRSRVSPTRPSGMRPTMPALNVGIRQQAGDLRRVDEGGHDRVDADAVARPLGRPLARQRADRALGRDVGRVAGVDAQVRAHRRDVQDRAAVAALDHAADDRLGRHERAAHVELHDPVPVVARVVLGRMQRLAGAAADRVDQDVDARRSVRSPARRRPRPRPRRSHPP